MNNFWRIAKALTLSLILTLALFGPGWAQVRHVVVDDRGREIPVPASVERVVVAGTPLYTETLLDLNARDVLVGITDSPNNPAAAEGIPTVGPSFPSPSIERIVELAPDVVFGAVFEVRDRLESAGLSVITPVNFIAGVEDLFALIEVVGLVVDRSLEAELLVGRISREIVSIESRVAQRAPRSAAFLFVSEGRPPFAAGRGSLEGELLARAGGTNAFADVEGGNSVSVETILERDPAVIFTDPSQIERITRDPVLAEVTAVANGDVVGIKASSLTSTRVAGALFAMARALHPDAFGGE